MHSYGALDGTSPGPVLFPYPGTGKFTFEVSTMIHHNSEHVHSETFGGHRVVNRRSQSEVWREIDSLSASLLDHRIPPRDIAFVLRLYAWHILSQIK